MQEKRDRSPPNESSAQGMDADTRALIEYTLRGRRPAETESSTQDLIDHVRGVKQLPESDTTQSSGSHRSANSEDTEWERKQMEELRRLRDVKLSDVGMANEPPVGVDHSQRSEKGEPGPTRKTELRPCRGRLRLRR